MVKATKTQQVEADCALVTFLRPSIAAGAISFQAWDGERFVGELHGMNSVSYLATPGEHVFFAKAENWAVTKAQLAAGKRYYLVLRLRNADVRARSREG